MNNIIKFNVKLFEHLIRQRYTLSNEINNIEINIISMIDQLQRDVKQQTLKEFDTKVIDHIRKTNYNSNFYDPLGESEKVKLTEKERCD
jgi:hypothetical protein